MRGIQGRQDDLQLFLSEEVDDGPATGSDGAIAGSPQGKLAAHARRRTGQNLVCNLPPKSPSISGTSVPSGQMAGTREGPHPQRPPTFSRGKRLCQEL